ncbi:MAG: hypothetical protein KGJ57_16555 [Sphingomonadales bacterium]|nr:hypothetical protein [Sphingomonadales bacterium]MDE2171011.1 hypothetical protein [Sphingomonadales bacterium]
MTDLDHLLAGLGDRPLDPRLAAIDASVFAGLEVEQRPALSRGALGVVTGLAMLGGVLATAWPAPAALAGNATPIGVPRELMPSTLLGEEP